MYTGGNYRINIRLARPPAPAEIVGLTFASRGNPWANKRAGTPTGKRVYACGYPQAYTGAHMHTIRTQAYTGDTHTYAHSRAPAHREESQNCKKIILGCSPVTKRQ